MAGINSVLPWQRATAIQGTSNGASSYHWKNAYAGNFGRSKETGWYHESNSLKYHRRSFISLTNLGKSLKSIIRSIEKWRTINFKAVKKSREAYDKRSSK